MAIWQVSFYLVSRNTPICIHSEVLAASLQILGEKYPQRKSWCDCAMQYGDLDSTCVELFCYDGETFEEINVRLDLTKMSKDQIDLICDLTKALDLMIQCDGELYEPTLENLRQIIRRSPARRFLSDPEKYLDELVDGAKNTN